MGSRPHCRCSGLEMASGQCSDSEAAGEQVRWTSSRRVEEVEGYCVIGRRGLPEHSHRLALYSAVVKAEIGRRPLLVVFGMLTFFLVQSPAWVCRSRLSRIVPPDMALRADLNRRCRLVVSYWMMQDYESAVVMCRA